MKFLKLLSGIALSVIIAAVACFIENLLPIHLIGGAVIAMFIGMVVNHFIGKNSFIAPGVKFTSKKILNLLLFCLVFRLISTQFCMLAECRLWL